MERPSPPAAEGGRPVTAGGSVPAPRRFPGRGRRARWLARLGIGVHLGLAAAAVAILGVVVLLVSVLAVQAGPSFDRFGPAFLSGTTWDGVHAVFGAAPAIAGTVLTSLLALALAIPVALGVAIFLSEIAPAWLRRPLTYVVDLSAAVPSVVYGFWAFIVLVPIMRSSVEPDLQAVAGGGYPFSGVPLGLDLFTATIVLAVMVLPTIAAISREALRATPRALRESAMSLGATRWETTRLAVLGPARSGIAGGVILGLGRALGETIAVAMVIGNIYAVPTSLLSPSSTLASQIANSFGEVGPGLEESALVELGLILLAVTLLVNVLARLLIWGVVGRTRGPGRGVAVVGPVGNSGRLRAVAGRLADVSSAGARGTAAWRLRVRASLTGRVARRRRRQLALILLTFGCLVLAVAPLASVVATATVRGGAAVVDPGFYVSEAPVPCNPRPGASCDLGGIGPAIEGTLVMLGLGSILAVPTGLFAGIYLSEYGRAGENRLARVVSFFAEVMTGVPTILVGVVVFLLFLRFDHGDALSAISGGLALGLVMVPIVTRATEEALKVVPASLREAAFALGFPRYRVALRVVLGSARSGVVTGILLGLSRAAGDTAALIVTAGGSGFWMRSLHQPTAAITPFIFGNFGTAYANLQEDAWGAALVLLLIMLSISVAARYMTRGAEAGPEAA